MTEQPAFSGGLGEEKLTARERLLHILGTQDQCSGCNKFVDMEFAKPMDDHVEFWYYCPRCGHKQGMRYNSKAFADRFREVFGDVGYRKEDKVS